MNIHSFCTRTKIDEIQQRKEEELKSMNIRIQKLQGDLLSANQVKHPDVACSEINPPKYI